MKKFLHLALMGAACISAASAQIPEVYFMADFNTEATMTQATVGKDMVFVNEVGDTKYKPIEFISDGNGVNKEDGYVYIPTGAFIKADFSALPGFTNPADPDNPYVGTYTTSFDVKLPKLGTYYCLFQSNPDNNTDAKLCINGKGNFGSGFLGGYDDSWAAVPDTWYRLTLSVNQADGRYALYVDGTLIQEGTSGNVSKVDGRYALEDRGTLYFADDNEEDAPIYCSKIMFFDRALTDKEVAELGSPKTEVTSSVEGIVSEADVNVYAEGKAIVVKANEALKASVFNAAGQLVGQAAVAAGDATGFNMAVSGIYVVVCTDAAGAKTAKKIMVK